MNVKILSVTKLKPRLLKVISLAQNAGQEWIVTKNGRPAAVIMSFDEWESWRETFDIVSDKKIMKQIRKSIAYFNRGGKGKSIEEVFGKTA